MRTEDARDSLEASDSAGPDDPADTSSLSRVEPSRAERRAFFAIAGGATVIATFLLLAVSFVRDDGHLAYAFDDAAIHLSVARQLVHHGTWGVSAGVYQSATSSPGWTLLLSGFTLVLPFAANALPFLLNIAAALWVVWIFAAHQRLVVPRRRDGWSVALAIVIPVVTLLLPTFALVGMEQTLQAALALECLVLVQRFTEGPLTVRRARWLLLVVLLGALVRPEGLFVSAGVCLAVLASAARRAPDARRWAPTCGLVAMIAAAGALPVVVFGSINVAFGQSVFSNSVIAKSALRDKHGLGLLPTPAGLLHSLQTDTIVFVLALIVLAYLFAAWARPRNNASVSMAITFLAAVGLHAAFAQWGSFDRYQAYLIIGGVFVALRAGSELTTERSRTRVLIFALILAVALSNAKLGLLTDTPLATSNTYRQRYQLGRFFKRYYQGRAVATGELGYASDFHDGPFTDLLGLGDYEVLRQLRRGHPSAQYWQDLVRRRRVVAIAMYPITIFGAQPKSWIFVGEWLLDEKTTTAFEPTVLWYAPDHRSAVELAAHLAAFRSQFPTRAKYLTARQVAARLAPFFRKQSP